MTLAQKITRPGPRWGHFGVGGVRERWLPSVAKKKALLREGGGVLPLVTGPPGRWVAEVKAACAASVRWVSGVSLPDPGRDGRWRRLLSVGGCTAVTGG
jgi:hypothetical protein